MEWSLRRGWRYKKRRKKGLSKTNVGTFHQNPRSHTLKAGTQGERRSVLLGGGGEVKQQLSAHRGSRRRAAHLLPFLYALMNAVRREASFWGGCFGRWVCVKTSEKAVMELFLHGRWSPFQTILTIRESELSLTFISLYLCACFCFVFVVNLQLIRGWFGVVFFYTAAFTDVIMFEVTAMHELAKQRATLPGLWMN